MWLISLSLNKINITLTNDMPLIAIYQQLLIPILAKPDKSYKIKSIFDI
jgi:hypothetical protein